MTNTCYHAFTDAAGGTGNDAYTIAIGHKEGENFIIDVVRGTLCSATIMAAYRQLN